MCTSTILLVEIYYYRFPERMFLGNQHRVPVQFYHLGYCRYNKNCLFFISYTIDFQDSNEQLHR
jgi:hypothetical protein